MQLTQGRSSFCTKDEEEKLCYFLPFLHVYVKQIELQKEKKGTFVISVVQKLDEAIPTLLRKLDELQNHSAQMPNISESISRIRQLIQEARNAASKVQPSCPLMDTLKPTLLSINE